MFDLIVVFFLAEGRKVRLILYTSSAQSGNTILQ